MYAKLSDLATMTRNVFILHSCIVCYKVNTLVKYYKRKTNPKFELTKCISLQQAETKTYYYFANKTKCTMHSSLSHNAYCYWNIQVHKCTCRPKVHGCKTVNIMVYFTFDVVYVAYDTMGMY